MEKSTHAANDSPHEVFKKSRSFSEAIEPSQTDKSPSKKIVKVHGQFGNHVVYEGDSKGIPHQFEGSLANEAIHFNTRDLVKETPLHEAAQKGDIQRIEFLIQQGHHLNAKDNDGNTPLMIAVFRGKLDAINLLLNLEANPNEINNSNETSLHYAIESPFFLQQTAMIKTLLEYKADPTIRNESGEKAQDLLFCHIQSKKLLQQAELKEAKKKEHMKSLHEDMNSSLYLF